VRTRITVAHQFSVTQTEFIPRENTMSRIHAIACSFAFVLASASALTSTQSHAVQRTHVSAAFGSDANTATNCTAVAPCRFFQAAMTVTDNNGEVIVLDSGGYGGVTITQSISLTAPAGVYAGISVFPGNNGVTVSTGGGKVTLRGLTINGQGGSNGIYMTNGGKLSIENCVIANLANDGILVIGGANIRITDTVIRDNGGNGVELVNGARATITGSTIGGNITGVLANGTNASTTTTVDIADSTIDGNNQKGVFANSTNATAAVTISVRDSRIVRSTFGVEADSTAAGVASLSVSNNIISNNDIGIRTFGAGAAAWASGNTVSNNRLVGLLNENGLFETAGNNAVRNNATNKSGVITAIVTE
jgi:hypothetical protein